MRDLSCRWLLVHFACTAALLVQLGFVFWNGYIRPSVTNTVVEERDLQDMDLPVIFRICILPGFNDTALEEEGYGSITKYFKGESKYNHSLLGWAGHTNTSGVRGGVAEVLARVRGHTARGAIRHIHIDFLDDESVEVNISNIQQRRVSFADNCYTLNITNNSDVIGKGIKRMKIQFDSKIENKTAVVLAEGSSLVCDRNINDHKMFSTGDFMRKINAAKSSYYLKIKKNVFMEHDVTKNCRNYPNPNYASYRDCDEQWLKDSVAAGWPGLVPVWLADDLEKVTEQYAPHRDSRHLADLFDGTKVSGCPLPCSTVRTETKMLRAFLSGSQSTTILIYFSPTVEVSTTDLVKPTISSFLSAVGGSVGLWLGLGAAQAVQILIACCPARLGGE
jgi:hypothetical protein